VFHIKIFIFFFTSTMNLQQEIIKAALSYVGKTEKPGNSGFNDPVFEQKMKLVGWAFGWAWCALFVELVLRESATYAGREPLRKVLADNFSASAIQNLVTFKNRAGFAVFRDLKGFIPLPGDIVVWQMGRGPFGHTGIVVEVDKNGYFYSVEGNTSGGGDTNREGDVVAKKRHLLGLAYKPKGLNIIGFIRLS